MTNDEIKAELRKYVADVGSLNAQLRQLEAQKAEVLKVGTRIEGVIAFLRGKLGPQDLAEIDGTAKPAAPAAPAA
jgi:hypothetical protein